MFPRYALPSRKYYVSNSTASPGGGTIVPTSKATQEPVIISSNTSEKLGITPCRTVRSEKGHERTDGELLFLLTCLLHPLQLLSTSFGGFTGGTYDLTNPNPSQTENACTVEQLV